MEKAACTLQHSSGQHRAATKADKANGITCCFSRFYTDRNFLLLQAKQTLRLSRAARFLKPVTSGVEGYCSHQPRCEPDGHANAGSQAGLGQASLRPTRFFMFSMRGRDTFSLPATSRTQVARAHRNIRGTRKRAASTYPHSLPRLPYLAVLEQSVQPRPT
jgi:hypothetical protein